MAESLRISVLTYDVPHRKTYDTLCLLKARGWCDVEVFAHPLSYKKTYRPLYPHRPSSSYLVPDTEMVCSAFDFRYSRIENYEPSQMGDVALVCGAGIIPQQVVDSCRIVNSHPGFVPLARGLDAFKWAILDGCPIGVTTHFLGNEVDAGEIIERRVLQPRKGEAFYELAMRVYVNEVDMLVDSLNHLDEVHEWISGGNNVVHRRMPKEKEREMMRKYMLLADLGDVDGV